MASASCLKPASALVLSYGGLSVQATQPQTFFFFWKSAFICGNPVNLQRNLQLYRHNIQCKGKDGCTNLGVELRVCSSGSNDRAIRCKRHWKSSSPATDLFNGSKEVAMTTSWTERAHWYFSFLMSGLFKTNFCLLK